MEFLTGTESEGLRLPPGVTPIHDVKNQKRANKTLSRAVSLHLEGKLENAARLLTKAIEGGETDAALFSALGHIQYEMRDYAAAAQTYARLVELEPLHRTGHFNRGVCLGNLQDWEPAADSFRRAAETPFNIVYEARP